MARFEEDVDRDDAGSDGFGRKRGGRKRASFVSDDPNFKFNYKEAQKLKYFLTDRGKIVPRRISGLTAKKQRELTREIRRARNIGLLPYTTIE